MKAGFVDKCVSQLDHSSVSVPHRNIILAVPDLAIRQRAVDSALPLTAVPDPVFKTSPRRTNVRQGFATPGADQRLRSSPRSTSVSFD